MNTEHRFRWKFHKAVYRKPSAGDRQVPMEHRRPKTQVPQEVSPLTIPEVVTGARQVPMEHRLPKTPVPQEVSPVTIPEIVTGDRQVPMEHRRPKTQVPQEVSPLTIPEVVTGARQVPMEHRLPKTQVPQEVSPVTIPEVAAGARQVPMEHRLPKTQVPQEVSPVTIPEVAAGSKGLLILFGESFRLGGQYTRNRGSEQSYDEQMNAARSHMKLISFLKQKHLDVEVSINSYTTKYDDDLTKIYKDVLYDKIFYPELIGQNGLIHNCMKRIINWKDYDFVLCMRIDICLKDKFMDIFNPYNDKILFPSICFEPHHKEKNHPRVNDMMLYVPKKYIGLFKEKAIKLSHRSWFELIEHCKLDYSELDTMLYTYHDSDSAKDYNPIYYIANRRENKIHRTKKIFDKYNF